MGGVGVPTISTQPVLLVTAVSYRTRVSLKYVNGFGHAYFSDDISHTHTSVNKTVFSVVKYVNTAQR